MVTIWDVAADAGVSKSTVSLVLNSSPLVKEETRLRVMKSIKALNYVPNYSARSLIRRRNNSIGIIHMSRGARNTDYRYEWSYSSDSFTHDVEEGVFQAIAQQDLDLSVMKDRYDLSHDIHNIPGIIRSRRVDGAIFIGGFDDEDVVEVIRGLDIPAVLVVSSWAADGVDTVFHSSYEGSRLAFKKLIETGHKRICLLNCPKSYFRVWPERVRGVRDAAAECGYALDERLLLSAEKNTPQSGYMAFKELLNSGLMPDAVLTANNEMAMGLQRCLYELNIRIPEDISVICYEDSSFCGNASPALSAVNVEKELIGKTAFQFLLNRINDPQHPIQTFTPAPHLIMRESLLDRRQLPVP